MRTVYLGLGSNVGERERALQAAIDKLQAPDFRILRISSVYETAPRDVVEQPHFLNLVLEAETSLFPIQLMKRGQLVERELGRKRLAAKGPRPLDVDLLLYAGTKVACPILQVPHPRLHERRFVLEPLVELAPDLRHPVLLKPMRELLRATAGQQVRKIEWKPMLSNEPVPQTPR
jgi:2-amino-4-hydroxy-6-hydroxymethyldihydropteridine diphosphokinase